MSCARDSDSSAFTVVLSELTYVSRNTYYMILWVRLLFEKFETICRPGASYLLMQMTGGNCSQVSPAVTRRTRWRRLTRGAGSDADAALGHRANR